MKTGKLPENVLKRSVFKMIKHRREEVLIRSGVGLDCTVTKFGADDLVVMSTDPITGTDSNLGKLAVNVTANDLASNGATPVGLMVTALLPVDIEEKDIKALMKEIDDECAILDMEVMGGHTEITPVVNQIVLSVAGVGKINKDKMLCADRIKPGFEIVVTKAIGLEGTSIIAQAKEEQLVKRYPKTLVEKAKSFVDEISVVKESRIAVEHGAVFMHDVTEGGIYGALWEVASAAGLGLEVYLKKIPVRQETIEICDFVDADPYKLISSGSMLIVTEHGNELVNALNSQGIDGAVIGSFVLGNDKIVINEDEKRYLEPPAVDELYAALDK